MYIDPAGGEFLFQLLCIVWALTIIAPLFGFGFHIVNSRRYQVAEHHRFCPECGEELHADKTLPCAKCGWRRPKKPRFPIWAAVLWGLNCAYFAFILFWVVQT